MRWHIPPVPYYNRAVYLSLRLLQAFIAFHWKPSAETSNTSRYWCLLGFALKRFSSRSFVCELWRDLLTFIIVIQVISTSKVPHTRPSASPRWSQGQHYLNTPLKARDFNSVCIQQLPHCVLFNLFMLKILWTGSWDMTSVLATVHWYHWTYVQPTHTHTHVENILTIGKHLVMHVVTNFKTPAAHLQPLDLDIHFCTHAFHRGICTLGASLLYRNPVYMHLRLVLLVSKT